MYFHKDDYLFFENDETPEGQIRFLKNFIEDKCECCICYNSFEGKYSDAYVCEQCGSGFCLNCICKSVENKDELLCPMCRSARLAFYT